MTENEGSTDDSWSTSEDNSSGNEYSVKTKTDKLLEEDEQKKIKKEKNRKKKKKHKKHKKKHKKHKTQKTVNDSASSNSEDDDDSNKHKNHEKKKKKDSSRRRNSHSDSEAINNVNSGKISSDDKRYRDTSCKHHPRSKERGNKRSKSKDSSSRKPRSSSRRRSHSKHRSRSRSHSRRRDSYRDKSRDRSRGRSKTSWDVKHVSSDTYYRKSRSRSPSQYRRRSRSTSHHRRRSRSSYSRRSRSRSRSRSTSHHRKQSQSPPKDAKKQDEPVFSRTTTSSIKKAIEIKVPGTFAADSKKSNIDPKSSLYGRWEAYEPQNKEQKDLNNFTKLCQEISAKEGVEEERRPVDDGSVSHPFKLTPAPVYLPQYIHTRRTPMNPAQAIMAGSMVSLTGDPPRTGPLEKHFPVSSGTDHRDCEHDNGAKEELPVYEEPKAPAERIDVSAVIARRLGAQQILNSNPNDESAKMVLTDCDWKLKQWSAQSKKPGKFTGQVGVRMNKAEIAGAIETWVRKDFFHHLKPVSGGVGMRMMQNMGWKQGQPLGRSNEGYVAPILFDVKVGRGGLQSAEEEPQVSRFTGRQLPKKRVLAPVVNVNGKHPVSALAEICTQKKLGMPEYSVVFEHGQAHNKNFLMKVTVQNVDYQPSVASPNKKHAKAQAAVIALRILGFITD